MSKCLIAHFSQGGTTARVGAAIAAGLRAAEWEVERCDIKDERPPGLDGYDMLGVGAPAYYYRPPFTVTDYVKCLPDLDRLPVFIYVLHGSYPGNTGNALRQSLARKGGREVGYYRCHGADYYLGYLREGYLLSDDHPTAAELAQGEAFGRTVADRVAGQEYAPASEDPPAAILYRVERYLLGRWMTEQVCSRLFTVNGNKCTACGLCIEGCPTGNIAAGAGGRPAWGRHCLLCLYCEMRCPEEAITSPMSWPLFRPVMRYNVHRALRDGSLDRARVVHSQGRTRRV